MLVNFFRIHQEPDHNILDYKRAHSQNKCLSRHDVPCMCRILNRTLEWLRRDSGIEFGWILTVFLLPFWLKTFIFRTAGFLLKIYWFGWSFFQSTKKSILADLGTYWNSTEMAGKFGWKFTGNFQPFQPKLKQQKCWDLTGN